MAEAPWWWPGPTTRRAKLPGTVDIVEFGLRLHVDPVANTNDEKDSLCGLEIAVNGEPPLGQCLPLNVSTTLTLGHAGTFTFLPNSPHFWNAPPDQGGVPALREVWLSVTRATVVSDTTMRTVLLVLALLIAAVAFLAVFNERLQRRLYDPLAVARGLATGYFYNFLHKLESQLNGGGLEVEFPSGVQRFSQDDVVVQLFMPQDLSKVRNVEREAARHPEATIKFPFPGRDRRINYLHTLNANGGSTLTIIDPVRPCFTIKDFLDGPFGVNRHATARGSGEANALAEFTKTIHELTGDKGPLARIVSWHQIG